MSIIDSVKEAVGITPTYTDEAREKVRSEARKAAAGVPWFTAILDHHAKIEAAFAAVKAASTATVRATAQKSLAVILTGHSIAEENVIYPGMSMTGQPVRATHAYTEQATAKREMAALDEISSKMSQDYVDKLEEIRVAVVHHMVEEESIFFPALKDKATPAQNAKLSKLYDEEFSRYVGDEVPPIKTAA